MLHIRAWRILSLIFAGSPWHPRSHYGWRKVINGLSHQPYTNLLVKREVTNWIIYITPQKTTLNSAQFFVHFWGSKLFKHLFPFLDLIVFLTLFAQPGYNKYIPPHPQRWSDRVVPLAEQSVPTNTSLLYHSCGGIRTPVPGKQPSGRAEIHSKMSWNLDWTTAV